jgi:exo-beta-1,3-glucanase (GH17 family)
MSDAAASSTMGVNFSNQFMPQPVAPATAARQIAALPVGRAKTFSYQGADLQFIQAASAGNLRLAVGIPNAELEALAQGHTQALIAAIKPYAKSIDWLCVGNEPLASWYGGKYRDVVAPATQNVHNALKEAGLSIGVTVPLNYAIMANSYPPSAGQFDPSLVGIITAACRVMADSHAPFMVNVYPFLDIVGTPQIPLAYCLFTAPQGDWVHDGQYTYKNIFDASLDALYVALGKIGLPDFPVVVGECGWPTLGHPLATVAHAQTFNQNLIFHCKSGIGTPRRSGPIVCYLFEMYDEANKPVEPGAFEVAWGTYDGGGQAKYALAW